MSGPLSKLIMQYTQNRAIPFHTPGHCGNLERLPLKLFEYWGNTIFRSDLSEITGFDDLHHPEGVLKESQELIAATLNVRHAFYLVNGSTSGILATLYSILKEGDSVLIPKNAHKSIIHGLILSKSIPEYIEPEWHSTWGIYGKVQPSVIEDKLKQNRKIKAVVVTCPTYEGIRSNLKEIYRITQQYHVPLIVDAAHGFLWNFVEYPFIQNQFCYADIVIYSVHKTGGSLTQSALLTIHHNEHIDPTKMLQALNIFQTSSPSYLLLASLEEAILYLSSPEGRLQIHDLFQKLMDIRKKIILLPSIDLLENDDISKIVVKSTSCDAESLYNTLFDVHHIEVEQISKLFVMFLCGIGICEKDLDFLYASLLNISIGLPTQGIGSEKMVMPVRTSQILTPYEAYHSKSIQMKAGHAIGKISQETIVTCPPGIPILIPGQVITEEHLCFLEKEKLIRVIVHDSY